MTGPILLAIDTAAPRVQLALLLADGTVDTLVDDIAKGHAEILFERIATLLARHGLAYADLQRVAVTTGPGSFTGLRIGLSAARGFGLALGVPVVGIPSLLAFALAAEGPADVLIDARRDEAYLQPFAGPGVPLDTARILPMAEARSRLRPGVTLLQAPFVDIAQVARFAATVDPADYLPHAAYVRDADAKPQLKGRVALVGS
ncbi:MAG: TsaB [Devosia sp.]|nr:TsaB [Devosia sp.]